jgi:hypothetical protein
MSRNTCKKGAWRIQYQLGGQNMIVRSLLRKQIAIIIDEMFKYLLDDKVGTPHTSELHLDDDIDVQPEVGERRLAGGISGNYNDVLREELSHRASLSLPDNYPA